MSQARVAFSTTATSSTEQPSSRAIAVYVFPTCSAAASAASYPPSSASRCRCPSTASVTWVGGRADPALFRCATREAAGVSRRARVTSKLMPII